MPISRKEGIEFTAKTKEKMIKHLDGLEKDGLCATGIGMLFVENDRTSAKATFSIMVEPMSNIVEFWED